MAKVYVIQETPHNFLPAEQYGEVEFLSIGDFNSTRNSLHNENLVRNLRQRLKAYRPETDYLVITGSPYVTAAVFLILGHRGVHEVQFLRWSNRDMVYTPLTISIPKIQREEIET